MMSCPEFDQRVGQLCTGAAESARFSYGRTCAFSTNFFAKVKLFILMLVDAALYMFSICSMLRDGFFAATD